MGCFAHPDKNGIANFPVATPAEVNEALTDREVRLLCSFIIIICLNILIYIYISI